MQKNLLFITVLILFSYASKAADSLPPLPLPEVSNVSSEPISSNSDISTWQKIKIFLGMGDKKPVNEQVKEKFVDQTHLNADSIKVVNANSNDVSHDDINNLEDNKIIQSKKLVDNNNLLDNDKKLDISDDFFKDVEKHLQEEDTIIAHKPETTKVVTQENSGNSDQIPVPTVLDSKLNQAANTSDSIKEKDLQIPSTASAIISLSEKKVSPQIDENKEKTKDKKIVTQELGVTANKLKTTESSQSFAISEFKKEIERRNSKKVNDLPMIPEKDLVHNSDSALNGVLAADAKQLKFISDEAKVLTIPNDDIILGELSENATIELMDFSSYVQMFWQDYERGKRAEVRQVISDFIENYDDNFNKVKWPLTTDDSYERSNDAFNAIDKQDTNKFTTLINNFPILWFKDKDQNSMLHRAVYMDNYPVVKFLIMKGIGLNDLNVQDETPLYIADKYNNSYVAYLLRKAGAISFSKKE